MIQKEKSLYTSNNSNKDSIDISIKVIQTILFTSKEKAQEYIDVELKGLGLTGLVVPINQNDMKELPIEISGGKENRKVMNFSNVINVTINEDKKKDLEKVARNTFDSIFNGIKASIENNNR